MVFLELVEWGFLRMGSGCCLQMMLPWQLIQQKNLTSSLSEFGKMFCQRRKLQMRIGNSKVMKC